MLQQKITNIRDILFIFNYRFYKYVPKYRN